ncbi:MAG: helix-turn-helix transcriptional regulator [Butyrivibrio sp.]|nr:helix-turn-helix transcriptional regulator [Butyrivibrio sp.]
MIEFGEQLRRAREEKGMTQQTLAEQLFVTRPTVSRWERGERYPDLMTTKRISEILDVSLDDLLSGKDISLEAERNPVVENKLAHNIVIALHAFVIFACLIVVVYNIINYFVIYIHGYGYETPLAGGQAQIRGHVSTIMMNANTGQIMPIIKIIMQIMVFSFGLDQAIKGKLSPKMTGGIIVLYLAFATLIDTAQSITAWITQKVGTGFALLDLSSALIPTAVGTVFAFLFFIRGSKKIIAPITIILVLVLKAALNLDYTLFWIGYMMRKRTVDYYVEEHIMPGGVFEVMSTFTVNNVLKLIVEVAIYGLIIFQTIALWIKRKKLEEAIMKNAEAEVKLKEATTK